MTELIQVQPVECKEPVEEAPCRRACPVNIDVPRYCRLISEGKFAEALAVIREKLPLPSICGRVCFAPCEAECRMNEELGPVMIRLLRRFVAERDTGIWKKNAKIAKATGKRVAIIGSGPAGLTAAYYSAKLGHSVTIFEALPEPGGMMRYGIPAYRLPRDVLKAEIEIIKGVGVDIKVNSKIDNIDSLFEQSYNAVFIAVGAHKPIKMGIMGEKDIKIVESLSLLKKVNLGKKIALGPRVAVVGGGNSAVDTARTALRLGSKDVTIVYRRSRADMPANQLEVEEALHEGVKMQFLTVPTEITRVNHGIRLKCIQVSPGKLDESLRPKTEPVAGSEFSIDIDSVISAIGEAPDIPKRFGLVTTSRGTLQVGADSVATSRAGVFAGGDAVSGPASVIEAIAAGRKAAISIDEYLGGIGMIDEVLLPQEEVVPLESLSLPGRRALTRSLPINERLTGFEEVDLGLTEEVAIEQANRCLRCDLPIIVDATKCTGCRTCQLWCSFRYEKAFYPSRAEIKIEEPPKRELGFGISFTNVCDTCGICVRYCPTGALSR